jgi:alpha 1,3-glucosidase
LFQGSASGTLYIDDGQSFDYRKNKYLYLSLEFKGNKLSSRYSLLFKFKHPDERITKY